jgi:hypothetical protein
MKFKNGIMGVREVPNPPAGFLIFAEKSAYKKAIDSFANQL